MTATAAETVTVASTAATKLYSDRSSGDKSSVRQRMVALQWNNGDDLEPAQEHAFGLIRKGVVSMSSQVVMCASLASLLPMSQGANHL